VHGQSDAIGDIISHADERELHLHNCEALVRKLRADILRVHRGTLSDSCTAAKAPIAISLSMFYATHHTATACTATKCAKAARPVQATAAVFGHGPPSEITAALARARELELRRAAACPTELPIRILQLSRGASVSKSRPYCKHNMPRARELLEFCLLREKASASELDLGPSRESRSKQMLGPPFRLARNEGGGGSLAAGLLQ
jgi:hypothetical protein